MDGSRTRYLLRPSGFGLRLSWKVGRIVGLTVGLMMSLTQLAHLGYAQTDPAEQAGSSHRLTGWTQVIQLFPEQSGQAFVYLDRETMPGCYADSGAYLVSAGRGQFESTQTLLHNALMTGQKVRLTYRITGDDANAWDRCQIVAVDGEAQ